MNYKEMTPDQVEYLVVHCSATPATADIGAKDIDRWHREQGYFSIGYHYVIRRNGTVETGRPLDQPGAHARGYNQKSIGVCLAGGVAADKRTPENNFTAEQFESLERLLRELKVKFPKAVVIGHGQLPGVAKACPSFDAKGWAEERGLN